jgi:limonene 1,2-monooxygenase
VVSLPYHHPFMVAERIVLLDHLTRGRVMLGVGPGALPYDAIQIGIDPLQQRPRMEESLEAIVALLRGERITRHTDWFTLDDAALQLLPYTQPTMEIAVTATYSPSGARLSGKLGTSMLSLNATQSDNVSALLGHWQVAEEQSALHGTTIDRQNWRLVGPMHIAETEEEARRDVAYGLDNWCYYMGNLTTITTISAAATTDENIDSLVKSGFAVIGTPDQAVAQIERLREASGGFGSFLLWTNDWAPHDATLRSYELFARHVMPVFQGHTSRLYEAEEYARGRFADLGARNRAAAAKAVDDYAAERAARQAGQEPQ